MTGVATVACVAVLALGCSSSTKTADACGANGTPCSTSVPPPTTADTTGSTGPTLATFPAGTVAVDVAQTDIGGVLVDGTGYTLYAFGTDTTGTPTCIDATCAATWKPITGTGIAVATNAGASTGLFKLVARPDGTTQLSIGGRPVYRFSGDTKPGDTKGQGIGGQWHAISPDGTLVNG
jgi:predicted lipoprotein with Yx(FWY)xxD motif